ncbi:hypothetical protein L1887_16822 [Cichorium endivia]|nr:hypothetical protein L1887_16822 [Cichorium endivia]
MTSWVFTSIKALNNSVNLLSTLNTNHVNLTGSLKEYPWIMIGTERPLPVYHVRRPLDIVSLEGWGAVWKGLKLYLFYIRTERPPPVYHVRRPLDIVSLEGWGALWKEYNTRKDVVEFEVAEFQKLPARERKKIRADAELKIVDRFARFS